MGWLSTVERVFGSLRPGDAVIIFGVHARSVDSAPIYQGSSDPLPPEDRRVYEDDAKAKRDLDRIRKEGIAKITEALGSSRPSPKTDIVGAIGRSRNEIDRHRTILLILSDMLNATPDLNLETKPLPTDDAAIRDLVEEVAQREHWTSSFLAGVRAYCFLNSVGDGGPKLLNNRKALHRFWSMLFVRIGARLELFETHLPDPNRPPWNQEI